MTPGVVRVEAHFADWNTAAWPLREKLLAAARWVEVEVGDMSDTAACDYDALCARFGLDRKWLAGDPLVRAFYDDGTVRIAQGFAGAQLIRSVLGEKS